MSASRSVTATFTASQAEGTLRIDDVRLDEGNSGTSNATFTVRLSAAATGTVRVNYATRNGTATAGSDYASRSGSLTFAAGETAKTVAVPVTGDTAIERVELFYVNLSGASGASISDGQAEGRIVNDDFPRMTINNVSVVEGDSGTRSLVFQVTLSSASPQGISVHYATANGTSAAGSDYQAKAGNLNFNPGETSKTISVAVMGDTRVETNERFVVNLSSPLRVTLADALGQGTITNDD
jgi:serralysin